VSYYLNTNYSISSDPSLMAAFHNFQVTTLLIPPPTKTGLKSKEQLEQYWLHSSVHDINPI